jgi:hypothetical protein
MKTTKRKELFTDNIKGTLEAFSRAKLEDCEIQLIPNGQKSKFLLKVPDEKRGSISQFKGVVESSALVVKEEDPTEYDDVMKIIEQLECEFFVDQSGGEVVALVGNPT